MTLVGILMAVAIGLVVGVIPGVFGVGGGFLMVPLLHVLAGVPIPIAVGCCSAQSLGTVTTGMLHRRVGGERSLRLAWLLFPGTLVGLELGIALLEWTKHSTAVLMVAGRTLPLMETVQLVCYLAIMLVLAAVVGLETLYNVDEHDTQRRGGARRNCLASPYRAAGARRTHRLLAARHIARAFRRPTQRRLRHGAVASARPGVPVRRRHASGRGRDARLIVSHRRL